MRGVRMLAVGVLSSLALAAHVGHGQEAVPALGVEGVRWEQPAGTIDAPFDELRAYRLPEGAIDSLPGEAEAMRAAPDPAGEAVLRFEERDGMPVVLVDVVNLTRSGRVPAAWARVTEETGEANWWAKVPVGAWETAKATATTVVEPPRTLLEYASQGPWQALAGAAVAVLGVRTVQGEIGNDIDSAVESIEDLFGGGGSGAPKPPASALDPDRPNVIAEKDSSVTVRDASQAVFPTIQARDGSTVTIDFQEAE